MPISTPYTDPGDAEDYLGDLLTFEDVRDNVSGWRFDASYTLLALAAATEVIEHHIGPVLPRATVTETLRGHRTAVLRHAPIVTGSLIRTDALDITAWRVDHEAGTVEHDGGGLGGIAVTYTPGRSPVPAAIRQAVLYVLQQHADSDQGAVVGTYTTDNYGPDTNASFTVSRGFYLPNRAKELLRPYWQRG